ILADKAAALTGAPNLSTAMSSHPTMTAVSYLKTLGDTPGHRMQIMAVMNAFDKEQKTKKELETLKAEYAKLKGQIESAVGTRESPINAPLGEELSRSYRSGQESRNIKVEQARTDNLSTEAQIALYSRELLPMMRYDAESLGTAVTNAIDKRAAEQLKQAEEA